MKKIYFTLFILFFAIAINAQQLILVPNDSAAISATVNDGFDPFDVHLEVINNTGTPASITWGLLNYTVPSTWEVKLCDNNNCYDLLLSPGPHVSLSVPNGDTIDMKFQYTSHCISGTGDANVYAYVTGGDSATTGIVFNYRATLTSNCVNAIVENSFPHLKIYANAAKNSFIVTGLENTGNISFEVYDMKGAIVKSEVQNASNTQMEISLQNLGTGGYILKAFDKGGNVIGTSRISKVE